MMIRTPPIRAMTPDSGTAICAIGVPWDAAYPTASFVKCWRDASTKMRPKNTRPSSARTLLETASVDARPAAALVPDEITSVAMAPSFRPAYSWIVRGASGSRMSEWPTGGRVGCPQVVAAKGGPMPSQNDHNKPNIVFIMADDIGWFNIGAYHGGIMAGRTPNLDRMAAEGMRFTDYYAEASCTAGRANFVTGQLPIRTGLTTVGQAGAKVGMPAEAPTVATALKERGYATGQFGKNHFGDRNEHLPTLHGFDEFFGYLYHLDAMEDPSHPNYPPALKDKIGPRNMLHCYASDVDDPHVDSRFGKVGKQRIEDAGELPPHPMPGIK